MNTTETLASTSPSVVPTASAAQTATISDYETFLVMMTTQLQNQDPTDPMDANEFAVQLATFSGVEQQVRTNDLLTAMTTQLTQQSLGQMAGWVGSEVRVAAQVQFDGITPITLSPNPAELADKTILVVTDASGTEVSRTEIPPGTANFEWDGMDAEGNALPEGIYTLELESYAGEELLGSTEIEHYAEVMEVRSSPAGATLLFDGEIEVPAIYVTGIRPGTAI